MRFFRFTLALITVTVLSASLSFAQDDDEPMRRSRSSLGGIVGGGIGPNGALYLMDASKLNASLGELGMPGVSEDGMFMIGGHGYIYAMVIPNLRIGGIGASGNFEESIVENGVYKSTELSASFGGVTIDYVFPLSRQVHIAVGGMVGGGSYILRLTRGMDVPKSWDDIYESTEERDDRLMMENSYLAYQPALTFEFLPNPFMAIALQAGYYGTSGDTWELNENFEVSDVPDFELNNMFLRLHLTFGVFIPE